MRRQLLIALAAFLSAACAHLGRTSDRAGELVEEAAGEALLGKDLDRALTLLDDEEARSTASGCYLRGDILDSIGQPRKALEAYAEALRIAHEDGSAPAAAIAAAMGTVAIRDRIDGFHERFEEIRGSLDGPGALPPEALFQLRNLALGLSMRRGTRAETAARLEEIGCLTRWEIAGPFGPNTWDTYDEGDRGQPVPAAEDSWPDRVDLGPGRGTREVERRSWDTCSVVAAHRALPVEGVSVARSTITLDSEAEILFRLETGSSARVFGGGVLLHEKEIRTGWPSSVEWFSARLAAGGTDITVELANPDGPPSFSLVATRQDGTPVESGFPGVVSPLGTASPGQARKPRPSADGGLPSRLATLRIAVWWEDRDMADEILGDLFARGDQGALLVELEAMARLVDRSIPGEVTYEEARASMETALGMEPRLLQSRLFVSSLEAADGRPDRAWRMLEEGVDLSPDEPHLLERKAEIASSMGWIEQLGSAVEDLERALPSSCGPLAWRLVHSRLTNRFDIAMETADEIRKCDSRSAARAEELTRAQRFEEALAEYRRLADLSPNEALYRHDTANAARALGDTASYIEETARSLELAPGDPDTASGAADALASIGRREEAVELLESLKSRTPGPHPILDRAIATLFGRDVYSDLRIDGPSLVARYESSGARYDTASVWVLDRAVHVVERDGGRTEIVHSVAHLKTDEAIESHGEISLPPGALVLTMRTLKKDGRILEPEEIPNKGTISLPDLEPGDFVEWEYATFEPPSAVFPGGFDTARFYFQDFDTAFHRSEMILISPAEMEVRIDPRGACPAPSTVERGSLLFRTWRVRGTIPRNREPMGPAPSEYLPSVRVISGGDWGAVCARVRDMLADRSRPTSSLDAAAGALREDPVSEGPEERASRAYQLVMERVEETGDIFEQASYALERGTGNRARTFAALMAADGRDARLALVRPLGYDDTATDAPTLEILNRAAVLLDGETWVSFDQDGAPFGYLPPDLRSRPALLVDECEFVSTDCGAVEDDSRAIEVDLLIHENGDAEARIVERFTGLHAAGWRETLDEIPGSRLEQAFQEDYLASLIPGATLERLETPDGEDPSAPVTLEYEITVPGFAREAGDGLSATLPFPSDLLKAIGGLPARGTTLVLSAPHTSSVAYTVTAPAAWTISTDARPGEIAWERGAAETEIRVTGEKLEATRSTRLESGRVSATKYPSLLEFATGADELSTIVITIYPQENHNNLTP